MIFCFLLFVCLFASFYISNLTDIFTTNNKMKYLNFFLSSEFKLNFNILYQVKVSINIIIMYSWLYSNETAGQTFFFLTLKAKANIYLFIAHI